MTRTQILLEPEQYAFLKDLSAKSGRSLSELVRTAVDEMRARVDTPAERLLACLGAHEADRDDVSLRHDQYLAEALGERR